MVSREPARRRVRLSLSLFSSSCEMGRAPNMSRNSLLSSTRDSFVLSVCTGARVTQALSPRSEEHTSELQSQSKLVCRLLLEKNKNVSVSCAYTQGKREQFI